MKLSVIALDFDGTIARNDVLDPAVGAAIAAARARGIVVLIVTGRILDDLRRVTGGLHFADGVVAENGAVLHFPDSGYTTALAPPVRDSVIAELRRRGILFRAGHCLLDADANEAPRLLDVIRALEVPLVLAFNGGRVMTLPQGVSKATGLRAALDILRLSARNTLAIGDAENDHELLRLAEVGVAVAWGSAALRAVADEVLSGDGPTAVAGYLDALTASGQLPARSGRRQLLLGHTDDGREFALAVHGRNVLVSGDAKSGKSWVAGLLCEQLILHGYCVCVIDPEGDYRSLEALPGVAVLGGEDPLPSPLDLLRALRYPDRSVVIDLSRRPHDEKITYIRALLPALNILRQRTGLPHRVLLDEAHYFLHDGERQLLDLERNGYTIVTYRASSLPADVLASAEVMLVTCQSGPAEVEALRRRCAACAEVAAARWSMLQQLKVGQAVALPVTEEAGGELRRFTLGPRLTPHVRHREKYVDVPVSEHQAFVFAPQSAQPFRAHTLRQFVCAVERMPAARLGGNLERGDFSRWIRDVFGDHAMAMELQRLEERHRAGSHADLVPEVTAVIRSRYELVDEPLSASIASPRLSRQQDAAADDARAPAR